MKLVKNIGLVVVVVGTLRVIVGCGERGESDAEAKETWVVETVSVDAIRPFLVGPEPSAEALASSPTIDVADIQVIDRAVVVWGVAIDFSAGVLRGYDAEIKALPSRDENGCEAVADADRFLRLVMFAAAEAENESVFVSVTTFRAVMHDAMIGCGLLTEAEAAEREEVLTIHSKHATFRNQYFPDRIP